MTLPDLVPKLALLLLAAALQSALEPAHAQRKVDEDYESFEEVCPYTNGDPQLERKLGYAQVGRIPWRGHDDSEAVRLNIGGIPMLFVETEHFRIGSSLTTYKIPGDKEERARLTKELARLEAKLGRLKAPRRELDPWLRLHLHAQRAEDLYRQFHEDWGIVPADYQRRGSVLGFPKKYLLLLCERKSEFGRYLRIYEKSEIEYSYRSGWPGDGLITCANFEASSEHWKEDKDMPLDSMFSCLVSANIAGNLVDGWNGNMYRAPTWLTYGYTHIAQRRLDPRWPVFDGRETIYGKDEDRTEWQPRISNLVRNGFFASTEEMMGWTKFEELNQRDHMVVWSKLDYLLTEVKGDPKAFLTAVCPALTSASANDALEVRRQRQTAALAEHFGLTPDQLDQGWSEWVRKTYRKK